MMEPYFNKKQEKSHDTDLNLIEREFLEAKFANWLRV